ncbi:MAG: cation:proton antiporter [Gemmatimonadaceae bacterium]|nr:cation:proton antiporter [Gemmatimonadaceae bacterium]
MDDAHRFLTDLAIVLGTAAVTTIVAQRLKLPVVFGYLVAGMIVGPYVPIPLVATVDTVRTLAELGVVLLMFALGLEFRLRRVARVAGTSGVPAMVETSGMFALGFLLATLFGWSPAERVVAGALVAISSTTVVARTFAALGERGHVADLAFGVLIVEDLVAILLIVVVGTVGSAALDGATLLGTLVRLALFVLLLIGAGLALVPRLVRGVVKRGHRETTLVLVMGLCFLAAWLALEVGYSVALGAFVMGSLVAESGHAHAIETQVHPLRDLFVAIFFVSVGMLIDPRVLMAHAWEVVAFTLLVVAGKVMTVSLSLLVTGQPLRDALRTGFTLAQIGEFSFIIAGAAVATGRVRDFLYPLAVAVSAITALSTPWLAARGERAAMALDAALPRPVQTFLALYASWIERVRAGRRGATTVLQRATRFLVIDAVLLALLVVGVLRFGPEARVALDGRAPGGAGMAAALVATIGLLLAVPPLVGIVRTTSVIARALAERALPLDPTGRLDHARAPRDALRVALMLAIVIVVLFPLLAALEPVLPSRAAIVLLVLLLVLLGAGFWRAAVRFQAHATAGAEVIMLALQQQSARADDQEAMTVAMDRVTRVLPGLGEPMTMRIPVGARADGQTLRTLNVRGRTGATILGITREGEDAPIVLPTGRTVLRAGDVLALAGARDGVLQARALLEAPARAP